MADTMQNGRTLILRLPIIMISAVSKLETSGEARVAFIVDLLDPLTQQLREIFTEIQNKRIH